MAEIKAEKVNIGSLLGESFQFEIPNFQRPLSWHKDNFDKLFEDIYDAFTNKQEEYFLGSIILQKQDNFYYIIDGQQRLAALAILLAVIRDNTINEDLKKSIQKSLFQEEDRYKGLPSVPRIKMWEDLASLEEYIFVFKTEEYKRDVKEGRVTYKDKEDPKYSLYEAIDLYSQKYNEKLKNNTQDGEFVTYLFNKVYVVYISTESLPYAIQLFNVLNTRGLPLTTGDILKAVNLNEIDEKKWDDYAKKWREIENDIGREEVEKVIEFIRTLKLKTKARTSIYEEYDKLIFNNLLKKGEEFIKYFESTSTNYRDIVLEPDSLRVDNKYKNLVKLMKGFITFDDWIPPLLAFYEKFYNSKKNKKSINEFLLDFLSCLEKKTVIEWIIGFTPSKRIESLNDIIKLIESEDNPENVLGKIIDSVGNEENKEAFKTKINGKDFYYENFAKYLLLRIDLEMWDQENFPGYQGQITVEHILPQNPSESSEWVKIFTEEEREEWTNKIGNLVLLGRRKNSRAQNYDFEKKKEAYFFKGGATPFGITQELQSINSWTMENLQKRQNELVDKKLIDIYFREGKRG